MQRLYSERLFPVCNPKLATGRNRITKAADLLKFPLLRLEDAKNWTRPFEAASVKATVGPGPVLNRASMLIDAAIDGHGIAGLSERVHGLGGTLEVSSPAGGPTVVTAHLPFLEA